MQAELTKEQRLQEAEYHFPYHYIPTWQNNRFSQMRHWKWGYRYLGGLQVVLDQLKKTTFDSLIDVGCGEGRFLYEVAQHYPAARLLGVEYTERPIQLAQALCPDLDFRTLNILEEQLDDKFDVVTAIEVLEHIPLDLTGAFVEALAGLVADDGQLVLTVPHINQRVISKHYQHFGSPQLRKLLSPHFSQITFIPFDAKSLTLKIWRKLLMGIDSQIMITNKWMNSLFFRIYLKRYLYTGTEDNCARIAAVCRL